MNIRLLIVISFFATLLSDVFYYASAAMHLALDATYFEALFRLTSLVCLLILNNKIKWQKAIPGWPNYFFKWLMAWNIITILRGAVLAENYWDWKFLFLDSGFMMLIPYAMLAGILFSYCDELFRLLITKLFIFGYLIIPLTLAIDTERAMFPRMMIMICFFILLIPYVKPKWGLAIVLVTGVSVYLGFDFRTNVIRIAFAGMLALLYYAKQYIPRYLLKIVPLLFITIPFVFLFLGLTGSYNVFKPAEDIDKYVVTNSNGEETNLAVDTRTGLYQEVLLSMQASNTFAFGGGATAKYKSAYFEEEIGKNAGRFGSEVGFLNMLLYEGFVGLILYALLLFSAIYYGIAYSNNFLSKMLALFLAFRWLLFFIEDYNKYDINNYFLFLTIGMCLSKNFRSMTDADIKDFFSLALGKKPVPQPA